MKRDYYISCLTYIMLIALDLALLGHFGCIAYYGEFVIQEQNPVMLSSEIAALVVILVFAIWQFVKRLRRPTTTHKYAKQIAISKNLEIPPLPTGPGADAPESKSRHF